METNEERRKLAERLRAVTDEELRFCSIEEIVYGCLANQNCLDSDGNIDEYLALQAIADLIEPEPDITCEFDSQVCGKIRCKRCGAFVSVDSVWDCFGCIPVRYCPNCGSKVIRNAD